MIQNSDSALLNLDIGEAVRYRTEYGFLETASLAVRFNFPIPPESEADLHELRKTDAHERQHLFQTAATSYGFYFRSLRYLQSRLMLDILHILQHDHGLKVTYPLEAFLRRLRPRAKYIDVLSRLRGWLIIEFTLLCFEGSYSQWTLPILRQFYGSPGMAPAFAEIDQNLSRVFAGRKTLAEYSPWVDPSDDGRAREDVFLITKATTDVHADVRSVLESGATIAEFWGADSESLAAVKAGKPEGFYWSWIHEASRRLMPDLSFPEFTKTFSALVDLALNGPILPQQSGIRVPGSPIMDVHPAYRLLKGIMSVRRVGPMRSMNDYVRFTEDVCDLNRWPSLTDTVRTTGAQMAGPYDFAEDFLFAHSLQVRTRHPSAFLSSLSWTDGWPEEEAKSYLTFPIMEFSNRKFIHDDRSLVESLLLAYIVDSYLRLILLSNGRTVQLPYSASDADIARLVELAESYWEVFEVKLPPIFLEGKPRIALAHRM
ncbi:hypothetical protein [Kitasatospora sp. NPDC048407]|uniref:hypothetical protein n=1 Tax=Kitasatospora sp. NPDC048407 TaxID=3364051 RepID=UPI00371F33FC